MFNKDVKVPLQEAELVGTSSSNIILSWLLTSQKNVEDFVDAKCRCNLVNWESGSFVNWESTCIIFKIRIICVERIIFKIRIICVTSFDYDSS